MILEVYQIQKVIIYNNQFRQNEKEMINQQVQISQV